jgi:hypothetical protein
VRKYIVRFIDRRHRECKFAVAAVNRRAALRQFLRRNRWRSLTVIDISEAS